MSLIKFSTVYNFIWTVNIELFACWVIFVAVYINLFKKFFQERYKSGNGLDPDQDRIWVQTVCEGYQQMTKVAASKERV